MNTSTRSDVTFALLAALWLTASGCASWTPAKEGQSPLQKPRLAVDGATLDFRFVDIPLDFSESDLRDWPGIDEQHLDANLRRRLEANGFRCGIAGSQLPAWLEKLVSQQDKSIEGALSQLLDDSAVQRMHSLQCRSGRINRVIVTSKPHPEMVVLLEDNGSLRGESYRDAQAVFELKTYPQGDGRVQLELTPQLEHGESHQRWIGQDGMYIVDPSRERRKFEELRIQATVSIGQVLVVGGTEEPRGLGGRFFTDSSSLGLHRRLLLMRVSKSQVDDLFVTEDDRTPVVPADE